MSWPRRLLPAIMTLAALAMPATAANANGGSQPRQTGTTAKPTTPIEHFMFLMQGDRTFDNYFGTYPAADGIPANACQEFAVARPSGGCVKPFSLDGTTAQPLGAGTTEIKKQYNKGKLDRFVSAFQDEGRDGTIAMGHYDQRDLGKYWDLASQYVLFDRFFASSLAGTHVNRTYWVAGAGPPVVASNVPSKGYSKQLTIFDRLQAAGVTWKFYVENYNPTQTSRTSPPDSAATQAVRVPLLNYARFVDDPALNSHIVDLKQYYEDLHDGTLPAVAYIASSGSNERSARSIPAGQQLVSDLIDQLALSKYWQSSAFLWSYDGSGGWYDHVVPPQVDADGYGLRVPALLVSAYARHGQVNHTVLDYTSALAFIEKNWQLAPLASRDAKADTFANAFDFHAAARPALVRAVAKPTRPHLGSVTIIYLCYGVPMALTFAILAFAAIRPSSSRRKPTARESEPARAQPVGAESP